MCNGVNIRKKIEIPKFDDSIFDYFIKPDINLVFKPKPIELTINSTGGSVYDAFFAIDAIKNLKIDVHTIASGYCASAATLLSLSGKKRFITKNTNMLIHEIRSGFWGKKQVLMMNMKIYTIAQLNPHGGLIMQIRYQQPCLLV